MYKVLLVFKDENISEKIKRMNKESGELFNSIKNDLYNIKEKKDD